MENLPTVRRVVVCLAFVALIVGASSNQTIARDELRASAESVRYRAGVRNASGRQRLSAQQRQQVLQSLREKTGWQLLDFDEAGFLVCPAPQLFNGGSAAARRLLGAALWGAEAYELESHFDFSTVNFARLAPGIAYHHHGTHARMSTQLVQLDFADFKQLQGEEPARQAFDLGIAILHELAHGVWHLRDASRVEDEPGECETFINQIRRELQLPERQRYQARVRSARFTVSQGTRLIAELHFSRTVETQGQASKKRYRLQWDAEAVGTVRRFDRTPKAGLAAALR